MAILHGLSPPPVETAHVLEIGCGDGMNLLAMAAAYPEAQFTGFDLAPTVIARGRARAAAAGLANVRLETLDILDAADALPGPFDYVIAHGVYAWVPEAARAALLAHIGRTLSPGGVAFISYNALPGGHFRMAVRELMLHYLAPDMDPATKLNTARRVLSDFIEAGGRDEPVPAAFRHQARLTLNQIDGLLFHDELAETYAPQSLASVARAAADVGLAWLGDAGRARLMDGFFPEDREPDGDEQAAIVHLNQERDFLDVRYFRRSLFVRAEARPSRRFDPLRLKTLWATTACSALPGGVYRGSAGEEFQIRDPDFDAAFARLVAARPGRLRADLLVDGPDHLTALMQLFDRGSAALHTGPAPFAAHVPDRPAASGLARAMLVEGLDNVCTLDHATLQLADPAARAVLMAMDGTRDGAALQTLARAAGLDDPDAWRAIAEGACAAALLVRP